MDRPTVPVFNYNRTPAQKLPGQKKIGSPPSIARTTTTQQHHLLSQLRAPQLAHDAMVLISPCHFFVICSQIRPSPVRMRLGVFSNWSKQAAGGSTCKEKVAGAAMWEGEVHTLVLEPLSCHKKHVYKHPVYKHKIKNCL
jgi:hypothetical protein